MTILVVIITFIAALVSGNADAATVHYKKNGQAWSYSKHSHTYNNYTTGEHRYVRHH